MIQLRRLLSSVGLVAIFAVAVGSASCAGSGDAIRPAAARQLSERVDQVRLAVQADDREAARLALRVLEGDVVTLRDDGLIESEEADAILAAAREVTLQLYLLTGPAISQTSPSSPTPSPSFEDEDKGKDKMKGKGKGNGNGNGNGNDKGKGN